MTKLIEENRQEFTNEINTNKNRTYNFELMVVKDKTEIERKMNKMEKEMAEGFKDIGENMIISDNQIRTDITEFVGKEVQNLQSQVENNKLTIGKKWTTWKKKLKKIEMT